MINADEGSDRAFIEADSAATEMGSLVDVVCEFVMDGEGVCVSFHVVANIVDVTQDGLNFVLCGLQICPNPHRIALQKIPRFSRILNFASLGLHSDKVTRPILGNVMPQKKRQENRMTLQNFFVKL